MGLKLTKIAGSKSGFFIRGYTTACLKFTGAIPENRLLLIIVRTGAPTVGKECLVKEEQYHSENLRASNDQQSPVNRTESQAVKNSSAGDRD